MFAAFLCTILFSVSSIFGHRSAKLIGGTEANFWRLAIATVLLGIWSFTLSTGLSGAGYPLLLLSGMIGIGLGDVAFFQALPRLGAPLSSLLTQCFVAPLGALIEWIWLGTTLSLSQLAFILVILLGVSLALAPGTHLKLTRNELVLGGIYCFLASLGTASGAVLSRKAYEISAAAGDPVDGANAAFQRLVGGLFVAGLFLLVVKRRAFKIQAHLPYEKIVATAKRKWAGVWLFILVNGVAGQTLGVSCMQWSLETTPAAIVLAIITLTPIIMMPFAWYFDGQKFSTCSVLGGCTAVAGAIGLGLFRHAG